MDCDKAPKRSVSADNFSDIAKALSKFKEKFSYTGQIDAYVYEGGSYNALLIPLLRRKLLLLNSDIIDNAESDNEVRWIIARFVGSLASRHYRFFWLQAVVGSIEKLVVFNMLMYPYERAVVKTGDQLGLYAIDGDIESAIRASHKLMVGGPLSGRINLAGVLRQHALISHSFFGWLAKCVSPFPHVTTRIVNLLRFSGEHYSDQLRVLLANADSDTKSLVQQAAGLAPQILTDQSTPSASAD